MIEWHKSTAKFFFFFSDDRTRLALGDDHESLLLRREGLPWLLVLMTPNRAARGDWLAQLEAGRAGGQFPSLTATVVSVEVSVVD
jgi:hypothetical protein